MHKSRKSPSRALLRREGDSLLFFMASRVKLIHGLLAPLRPTTTYVHGCVSLPRFHSPLCSKEHVELISSGYVNQEARSHRAVPSVTLSVAMRRPKVSRQRKWLLAQLKAGRCAICGTKRKHYKYRCDPCQERHRKATRRLTGHKPYSGGRGIAPKIKDRSSGHSPRARGGR